MPQKGANVLPCNSALIFYSIEPKEYVSVIEGAAPPCVFQTFAHQPLPALSDSQVVGVYVLQTEQGEVGWANVWKTQVGAVPSKF